VQFRTLESVLAAGRGVDDPEKLKRFLYEEWSDHNLGLRSIGGDVSHAVRLYDDHACGSIIFYPSDLYYSALTKPNGSFDDWNARRIPFTPYTSARCVAKRNKNDSINYDEVTYHADNRCRALARQHSRAGGHIAAKTILTERSV